MIKSQVLQYSKISRYRIHAKMELSSSDYSQDIWKPNNLKVYGSKLSTQKSSSRKTNVDNGYLSPSEKTTTTTRTTVFSIQKFQIKVSLFYFLHTSCVAGNIYGLFNTDGYSYVMPIYR